MWRETTRKQTNSRPCAMFNGAARRHAAGPWDDNRAPTAEISRLVGLFTIRRASERGRPAHNQTAIMNHDESPTRRACAPAKSVVQYRFP